MAKSKITPLVLDSYLAAVKNSIGVKTYRNFYAKVGGKRKDILKNGDLSCAWFVSSILVAFGSIHRTHTTVLATVEDLKKSGWKKVRKPEVGSVLIWGPTKESKGHKHIGFYLGGNGAVSNSSRLGHPVLHHWTFGRVNGKPKRKVEAIYWSKKLQ